MTADFRPMSLADMDKLNAHAESLLHDLAIAKDRAEDRELRRKLLDCVGHARLHGVHLGLAEPGTRLGGEMFFANRRAAEKGWL